MRPDSPEWIPANSVESALQRCLAADDNHGFLSVLCAADLFLPEVRPDERRSSAVDTPARPTAEPTAGPTAAPAAGPDRQRLLTTRHENRTYLAVFTSPESMSRAVDDLVAGWRLTSMGELTAKWPDERWGLAVNPGLPIGGQLNRGQVAELGGVLAALPPFRPGAPLEPLLHTAARNADLDAYLIFLSQAPILVGRGPAGGPPYRVDHDDRGPLVVAYTSAQRLADDGGDLDDVMYTDFASLARDWPDPGYRLVVNRGTPLEVIIDGDRVPALPGEVAAIVSNSPPIG